MAISEPKAAVAELYPDVNNWTIAIGEQPLAPVVIAAMVSRKV